MKCPECSSTTTTETIPRGEYGEGRTTYCNDDHSLACEWSEWTSPANVRAEERDRREEDAVQRWKDRT